MIVGMRIEFIFIKKVVNSEGGADKVVEFTSADSPQAEEYGERQRIFIKDREPKKYLPGEVCKILRDISKKHTDLIRQEVERWDLFQSSSSVHLQICSKNIEP